MTLSERLNGIVRAVFEIAYGAVAPVLEERFGRIVAAASRQSPEFLDVGVTFLREGWRPRAELVVRSGAGIVLRMRVGILTGRDRILHLVRVGCMRATIDRIADEVAASAKKETWWEILKIPPDSDRKAIASAWRRLAAVHHPDMADGSHEAMTRINLARDEGLRRLG